MEKHIPLQVGAFHNSAERFDPPKCYPKTREAIFAKSEKPVRDPPATADHDVAAVASGVATQLQIVRECFVLTSARHFKPFSSPVAVV